MKNLILILVATVSFVSTQKAFSQEPVPEQDPRVIQDDDIEKLSDTAVDLLMKCKDMKGKKAVAIGEMLNKTEEHIDMKRFSKAMTAGFKNVRVNVAKKSATLPVLKLELTAKKSETGNVVKSVYWLNVRLTVGDEGGCAIESKFEKSGQF